MNLSQQFKENGIITLKDYFSEGELTHLIRELQQAESEALEDLRSNWGNQKVCFFTTMTDEEDFVTTSYFQESATKAHLFYENIEGELVINRMGHGLHLDSTKELLHGSIYGNPKLNEALKSTGLIHPHCLLSIYIPKHARGYGSDVKPHQESSFAHTTPLSSKVLWVALEDATIENACMWGLRASHRLPLKYISVVNHQEKKRKYEKLCDAEIPDFVDGESIYYPLEVKAGDAILFDGNFVHCSPQNRSRRSRRAISFQFIETFHTEFSPFNWIREPRIRRIY
jgi:hypothetical protein